MWFTRPGAPRAGLGRLPPEPLAPIMNPVEDVPQATGADAVWGHPKESDRLDAVGLTKSLSDTAVAVETVLDAELPRPSGAHAKLFEAMRYSVLGGGKRLRAFLVRSGARLAGADDGGALLVAAALEMVHGYSLIHDDLPAMDDDDLRRGKPSCHVAFDEATAILAGDALLTLAFELAADPRVHPDPSVRCELVRAMAAAAGGGGMVGGQMIDLAAEHGGADHDLIVTLERMKTGALIAFGCEAGAILARRDAGFRRALREFGYDVGLAFQIIDDVLDVVGDESALGKTVGKDAAAGKATFVAALGVEAARKEAGALVERALARLDGFGDGAGLLRDFGAYVLARRS